MALAGVGTRTTNSSPTAPTRQYSKKRARAQHATATNGIGPFLPSRASSTREHNGLNPKGRRFPGEPTMELCLHLRILPPWLQKQAGFPGEDVVPSTTGETRWYRYTLVLHLPDLSSKEPRSNNERSEWMRLDHANSG